MGRTQQTPNVAVSKNWSYSNLPPWIRLNSRNFDPSIFGFKPCNGCGKPFLNLILTPEDGAAHSALVSDAQHEVGMCGARASHPPRPASSAAEESVKNRYHLHVRGWGNAHLGLQWRRGAGAHRAHVVISARGRHTWPGFGFGALAEARRPWGWPLAYVQRGFQRWPTPARRESRTARRGTPRDEAVYARCVGGAHGELGRLRAACSAHDREGCLSGLASSVARLNQPAPHESSGETHHQDGVSNNHAVVLEEVGQRAKSTGALRRRSSRAGATDELGYSANMNNIRANNDGTSNSG
ncbi:hypothetical protein FB451DRAFT_1535535 [Mycena latifolia]|nr:hypothetical protein FB451DRAFT_1535535 [Mycena latifolia]